MKSVFLTFIIFIVLFIILDSGIVSVLSNSAFHYTVYGFFIIVVCAGLYFVGLPKKRSKAEGEKNGDE